MKSNSYRALSAQISDSVINRRKPSNTDSKEEPVPQEQTEWGLLAV